MLLDKFRKVVYICMNEFKKSERIATAKGAIEIVSVAGGAKCSEQINALIFIAHDRTRGT